MYFPIYLGMEINLNEVSQKLILAPVINFNFFVETSHYSVV